MIFNAKKLSKLLNKSIKDINIFIDNEKNFVKIGQEWEKDDANNTSVCLIKHFIENLEKLFFKNNIPMNEQKNILLRFNTFINWYYNKYQIFWTYSNILCIFIRPMCNLFSKFLLNNYQYHQFIPYFIEFCQ